MKLDCGIVGLLRFYTSPETGHRVTWQSMTNQHCICFSDSDLSALHVNAYIMKKRGRGRRLVKGALVLGLYASI